MFERDFDRLPGEKIRRIRKFENGLYNLPVPEMVFDRNTSRGNGLGQSSRMSLRTVGTAWNEVFVPARSELGRL